MTRARSVALVYATHRRRGGAERYLNQLATHLAEAGHEVTVVCRRHEDPPHSEVRFARLPVRALGNAWRHWAFARAVERHVARTDYDVVVGLGRTWSQDVIRCGGCHGTWLAVERERLMSRFDRARGKGSFKGWVAQRIEPGRCLIGFVLIVQTHHGYRIRARELHQQGVFRTTSRAPGGPHIQ